MAKMARSPPDGDGDAELRMKIHSMCMVKNEADVIEECLEAAAAWSDHIYVFDNGSTDGTWEKVQALARRCPAVVPFKQDPVAFSDGLRADIHEAFRNRVQPGDWWCRLDADEFYVDDPRVFLAKVPAAFEYVVNASLSYYFTDVDAAAWEADPEAFARTPVQERLRHYVNHWSEPRFMRASPTLAWSRSEGGWPRHLYSARAYPVRIWVKHFCYRSPEQIERRLASRRGAIESGTAFGHEAIADFGQSVAALRQGRPHGGADAESTPTTSWRDRIVPASALAFDAGDRRLEVNEHLMPPLGGGFDRPLWKEAAVRVRDALRALRPARGAAMPGVPAGSA